MKKKLVLFALATLLLGFLPEQSFSQSGTKPEVVMYRYNSNGPYPSPVLLGDVLGTIKYNGLTAIGSIQTGASIFSTITDPVSPGSLQANIIFRTSGPSGLTNRVIITEDGRVGIGTMTPSALPNADFMLHTIGNTHTTGDFFGRIHMDPNLGPGAAPNTYLEEAYFEFKQSTDMVPTTGLTNLPSSGGLLTLAPSNNSGGANNTDHQLFFNRGGIFHRQEQANNGIWTGNWEKLLTSADIMGRPNLISKFLPPDNPSSDLGESQLFDNGTNVVIGGIPPGPPGSDPTPAFALSDLLTVNGTTRLIGKVAIGPGSVPTTGLPDHSLYVGGSILTEEVKVELKASWPDYVFEENYSLTPLSEKEKYVCENKHLPGVPTAKEVAENGLLLGTTQHALTQNLEEVYLHLFEMEKRIIALEQQNKALQQENEALKAERR